ncbi:MAG: hypothetical protein M1608_11330 [Candidatus Omnitrophica bacterium]|nr:hypothetical protein [Candidatus Omnitrophota bacterium]
MKAPTERKKMSNEILQQLGSEGDLSGDPRRLLHRLGSTDGLVDLASGAASLFLAQPADESELRRFLHHYRDRVLIRVELPAIYRACQFAHHGAARELIALDISLAEEADLKAFARLSRRAGQSKLESLRPLRDQRVVQRYLQAVENGQANGWHFLVFGLVLALYSIPIRQGLMSYALLTLQGFVQSAGRSLAIEESAVQRILDELCATLPAELESVICSQSAVKIEKEG